MAEGRFTQGQSPRTNDSRPGAGDESTPRSWNAEVLTSEVRRAERADEAPKVAC
jgi:hypothetical protein